MVETDITRKITLSIAGFPEEKTDNLEDFLDSKLFKAGEWDIEYGLNTDEYPIVCIFKETGTLTIYPGCYTLPNGDPGYPDEYEDNLEVDEDYVKEHFEQFLETNGLSDVEFVVEQDEDY